MFSFISSKFLIALLEFLENDEGCRIYVYDSSHNFRSLA